VVWIQPKKNKNNISLAIYEIIFVFFRLNPNHICLDRSIKTKKLIQLQQQQKK
jgi:hypothetical protein